MLFIFLKKIETVIHYIMGHTSSKHNNKHNNKHKPHPTNTHKATQRSTDTMKPSVVRSILMGPPAESSATASASVSASAPAPAPAPPAHAFYQQRPDLIPRWCSTVEALTPPRLSRDMFWVVTKTMVFCKAKSIKDVMACVRKVARSKDHWE